MTCSPKYAWVVTAVERRIWAPVSWPAEHEGWYARRCRTLKALKGANLFHTFPHQLQQQIERTYSPIWKTFAIRKDDETVVTWGSPDFGGDSSVASQLTSVAWMYHTEEAFAALKHDGTVVT